MSWSVYPTPKPLRSVCSFVPSRTSLLWSEKRKKLVGRIILAKFLELPLEEYKKFIDKVERSKLFKRLVRQGCLKLKEFPNSSVFDKYAELPANCIALIEGNKIFYAHPRFNSRYIWGDGKVDFGSQRLNVSASKKLCSRREQETATFSRRFPAGVIQQSQIENLLRDLRKISTRNRKTHAILSVILNHQKKYFQSKNLLDLKPLTAQMIKEMAKDRFPLINNCVISRLIKGKTIAISGEQILYLKDLIPSKKEIYKRYIKNIIQEECSSDNLGQLLNDKEIKKILKKRYSISISRRSICQTRKELGISSWRKRRKRAYCQLTIKIFSTFYPLERKTINRYAPDSPGAYELCINGSEIVYPKRKSSKFYLGSAKNIKKRLLSHLNPNHKNTDIAKFIKNHKCFFRFARIVKNWRKTEKQLYNLFIETYGVPCIGNKLSP